MSVRGIGEGHRSSIGFRTGVIDGAGGITSTIRLRSPQRGDEARLLDAAVFRSELTRVDDAGEAADYVLDRSASDFTHTLLTNSSAGSRLL